MTLLTTNNCLNPSFEVNVTDDWALVWQAGAGATWTRDTTYYKVGAASGRLKAGNGVGAVVAQTATLSVPNGATVSLSGWIRASADPSWAAIIILRDAGTVCINVVATAACIGAWEYVSGSWLNNTGVAKNCYVGIQQNQSDSATYVSFDACQLELAAAATTYTDGSLGGQCAWTGTAHNSTSTRTLATQALAGAQTNTGTVTKKTLKTLAGTMTNTGIVAAVKGLGLLLIARLRDYFLRAEQADHDLTAEFRDYTLTAPQREKHA